MKLACGKVFGRGKAKKTGKGMVYTVSTKSGFKGRKKKSKFI